jgi:CheY-like chemotaxis protein
MRINPGTAKRQRCRVTTLAPPDLMFLDIGMPKMDGISIPPRAGLMEPKLAIILVTATRQLCGRAF